MVEFVIRGKITPRPGLEPIQDLPHTSMTLLPTEMFELIEHSSVRLKMN